MKNEQLYNETVNIILDAYNKKQLQAGHPCGCFIGNIVGYRLGITETNPDDDGVLKYESHWYQGVVSRIKNKGLPNYLFDFSDGSPACQIKGMAQIQLTGYSVEEVLELEKQFEEAAMFVLDTADSFLESYEEVQNRANYEGMKAALILLAELHETKDEESIVRLNKIREEVYENCALV